jgi:hypothetical protein
VVDLPRAMLVNYPHLISDVQVAVLVTEWKQFRSPDFSFIKSELADQVIFDGRNLYEPDFLESIGIAYYAIGRGRSILAQHDKSRLISTDFVRPDLLPTEGV